MEEPSVKVVLKSSLWTKISQLHCFLSGPHCVFDFMFFLAVFHPLANNCISKIYCILMANKYEIEASILFL